MPSKTPRRCPDCGSILCSNRAGIYWCSFSGGFNATPCRFGLGGKITAAVLDMLAEPEPPYPDPQPESLSPVSELQVRLAHEAVAGWDGQDDAELITLLSSHFGRDLWAELHEHDDGKQVISGEGEPY